MAKPVATVGFIVVVAVIAVVVGTRRTVVDGRVLEADLLAKNPNMAGVVCDREIPIDANGARFGCVFTARNGGTVIVEATMHHGGAIDVRAIGGTPATRQ